MVALLKLRFLAFQCVFQQMDLVELYQLSLLSKRTKNCIRTSIRKNKFHVRIKMDSVLKIWPGEQLTVGREETNMIHARCSREEEYRERKATEYTIGGYQLGVVKKGANVCLYWRLRTNTAFQEVVFELFKHVIELLNGPMVSVTFDSLTRENDILKVLKFIRQVSLPVHTVECKRGRITAGTYTYFMNECKDAKYLYMEPAGLPRGFMYIPPTPQAFQMVSLKIANDRWVNLEDFMGCQEIYIQETDGGPKGAQKLNTFLKKWANSSSPLSTVTWMCDCSNHFEAIVKGLGDGNIEEDENIKYLDFVKSDGREASISCVRINQPMMTLESF